MPADFDPRDAELRSLFHGASAPASSLDAATIIRRSRMRRLPRQLGAGSVLTLAVAGIGVASFTGLRALAPIGASQTAADAPAGVSEGAPVPWSGADSVQGERSACDGSEAAVDAVDTLTATPSFPETAAAGHPVTGQITLTNSGADPVTGHIVEAVVGLTGGGVEERHHNAQDGDTSVDLEPGESMDLSFTFTATTCESPTTPLEPGRYDLSAVVRLASEEGSLLTIGGPASVIVLR